MMVLFDVFKCLVARIDLFLTTVYIKRTHQAMKPVTTKITISIIDEFHGHVFCVLERTVSSKQFF